MRNKLILLFLIIFFWFFFVREEGNKGRYLSILSTLGIGSKHGDYFILLGPIVITGSTSEVASLTLLPNLQQELNDHPT